MKTLRLFLPDLGPLAEMDVYRRDIVTGERAQAERITTLTPSRSARVADLLLVQTPPYIEALRSGEPPILASSWGVWFPSWIDVSLSVLGAFLDAIDSALVHGASGMLGGGDHHVYPPPSLEG